MIIIQMSMNTYMQTLHQKYERSFAPKDDQERLLQAAGKGDLQTVRQLLDAGLDIETRDISGRVAGLFTPSFPYETSDLRLERTPLHFACLQNQVEVAKCLLERAKKEGRTLVYSKAGKYSRSPLTDALKSRSQQCVPLLLDEEIDLRRFPPAVVERCIHSLSEPCCPETHNLEGNPLLFAIHNVYDEAVEKMLYLLGRQKSAQQITPFLLSLVIADIAKIILSYHIGDSSEFLRNEANFNLPLLELARASADSSKGAEKESAKRIEELLIEAGAKPEAQEAPSVSSAASGEDEQVKEPLHKKRKTS